MLSFSTARARVEAEQLGLLEEYGDPEDEQICKS